MGELMLVSVGDDIRLWDSATWGLVRQFNPHDQNISAVCWSYDGSIFGSVAAKDDKVSLNYVKNNTVTTTELPCQPGRLCLDFSSNARYLVTGGTDCLVNVWDLKGRKLKTTFKEHKGPVTCTQFNWNDSYIASGSETGEIILHNFVTGQSSSPLVAPKVEAIRQLQYNYYKKSLLGSASDDGAINLWDTNTRRLLHSFNKVHMAPATGLAFSPLNEMLMISVGLDQKLVCYDLQGKRTLKSITAESPLTSVDIMNNGGTVAVGSTRGKVFIYDLRQGATPVKMFSGHKSSVPCLKFQPSFDFKKNENSSSSSQTSARRQLPSAPQRNVDTASSSAQQVHISGSGMERQSAGVASAAIIDVVSPLREEENAYKSPKEDVYSIDLKPLQSDQDSQSNNQDNGIGHYESDSIESRGELDNRSGSLLVNSAHQNDSGQGVFSPLSNSLGLNASDTSLPRRHQFNERGLSPLVHSPSLQNQVPSVSADGTALNARYQAHISQEDSNVRTLPNGHTDFESPTRRKRSPKGICASPSLPSVTVQSSAEGAEGDVTDSRAVYNHVTGDSPRSGHTSSRVDPRLTSPTQTNTAVSQQLRLLVRDAVRDYSEQMQDELKVMFRKATQSPKSDGRSASSETSMFQTEFIRNLIREALEEFREDIHRDLQSVHLEMLRQFQYQQAELISMLEQYSVNRELVAEVERLREENRRLKKNF